MHPEHMVLRDLVKMHAAHRRQAPCQCLSHAKLTGPSVVLVIDCVLRGGVIYGAAAMMLPANPFLHAALSPQLASIACSQREGAAASKPVLRQHVGPAPELHWVFGSAL